MRTTVADVKGVLLDDYDVTESPSLVPFIEAASLIVDEIVVCVSDKGKTALSAARLEMIERWLSAHCYVMSDQNYSSRSNLRASGAFQGQTAMGLEASKYGQMACTLDPSGCLFSMYGPTTKARTAWGGKRKSNQTDYTERD